MRERYTLYPNFSAGHDKRASEHDMKKAGERDELKSFDPLGQPDVTGFELSRFLSARGLIEFEKGFVAA